MRKQRNRCLPDKAVAIWHQLDDRGHMQLVKCYFLEAGKRAAGSSIRPVSLLIAEEALKELHRAGYDGVYQLLAKLLARLVGIA